MSFFTKVRSKKFGKHASAVLCTGFCLAAVFAFAWPLMQAQTAAPAAAAAQRRGIQPDAEHPILAIGSPAPDFALPGIDDKTHTLAEFSSAKVLAVVFESNHCPVSIAYEDRIRKIHEDYKDKGVALVAINPNNASAVRLNELGYTDSTDSMPEMKIRAALRHIDWPYLYDGQTQATATKFGAVATPHIFIFDQDRKLRYEGRIDDSTKVADVKSQDARNAIDALLAGKAVPVASTPAFGCSTKWLSKATGVNEEMTKINAEPVTIEKASASDVKQLLANPTDKVLLVNFWSTKCKDCADSFHDFETTYRMYRLRKFDFVTVSTDDPSAAAQVTEFLQAQHASGKNLQLDSTNANALRAAAGSPWDTAMPMTMVIAPGGKVIYQKTGKVDILDVRRHILASIPNDGPWDGVQEYWTSVIRGN